MAAFQKSLRVYFYAIEPMQTAGGRPLPFEVGQYPLDTVLGTIRGLDPAADEYRIQDGLFAGETFCVLHEDGPRPVLGAYYRDNLSKFLTEFKGEISTLHLRDGEAIVDAAYAAFFPGDVIGLVRTSSKAPGFAKIGQWLSLQGGFPCALFALRDPNTLSQLDGHPTGLRRIMLSIRRERINAVEPYSKDIAKAMRAAADVNLMSGRVGIEFSVESPQEYGRWSELARQEIEDLMGVLPDFEAAKVKIAGIKDDINLLRANIQRPVSVTVIGSRRVGPNEAADALFQAYDQERSSIELALEARQGR